MQTPHYRAAAVGQALTECQPHTNVGCACPSPSLTPALAVPAPVGMWAAALSKTPAPDAQQEANQQCTHWQQSDQTHLDGRRICLAPVDNHLEGVLDLGYGFHQLGHLVARRTGQGHLRLVDDELDGIVSQGIIQGHTVHCVPVACLHSGRQGLLCARCARWRLTGILPQEVTCWGAHNTVCLTHTGGQAQAATAECCSACVDHRIAAKRGPLRVNPVQGVPAALLHCRSTEPETQLVACLLCMPPYSKFKALAGLSRACTRIFRQGCTGGCIAQHACHGC